MVRKGNLAVFESSNKEWQAILLLSIFCLFAAGC